MAGKRKGQGAAAAAGAKQEVLGGWKYSKFNCYQVIERLTRFVQCLICRESLWTHREKQGVTASGWVGN